MKKTLLVLLISILGISINASAQAYDFTSIINGSTIYFKITDKINNKVKVTSELSSSPYYQNDKTKPEGSIIIPESIINNGIRYSVNSFGDFAFVGCKSLTSITIPSSIISIGKGAFQNCTSLDSIFFNAEKCKNFGEENYLAFDGCINLKTIVIGEDVTRIPAFAFAGVTSLATIIANPINPPKIRGNTFKGVSKHISVYIYYSAQEAYKEDYFWKEFNN